MADLGQESLLASYFDGDDDDPVAEAKQALKKANGFIDNWYQAVKGSDSESVWNAKIKSVQDKVTAAATALDPETLPFTSKTNIELYNDAGAAFADMWRQLNTSYDTLPQPGFLDKAAEFLDDVIHEPGRIATALGDALSGGVSDTLGAILKNLWPWLLAATVGYGLYLAWRAGLLKKVFNG